METAPSGHKGGRAVVLGGGIGGLIAAVGLARHFEEVCIVERDRYSHAPSVRTHVPQGHHVHVLLAGGLHRIASMLPELPGWLDELDLREGDLTRDVRMNFGGKWLPAIASGIPVRPCTRPIMEHLLLRAARARDNLTWREGHLVTGLVGDRRVTGVRVRDEAGDEHTIEGDLVVEAGGRSSKLPQWLSALSVGEIPERTVDARISYASCTLRPPAGSEAAEWVILVRSSRFPDEPEMAAIMRVEDGNWLAALISYDDVPSPKSHAEFLERLAARLPGPYGERLRHAEPLSPIRHYANTANRRRYFGRVERWPERLVALGDSVCALNPRYGQGMTVAAMGVDTLGSMLDEHWSRTHGLDGLSRRFHKALDKLLHVPWQTALMEDRLWAAKAEGRAPSLVDAMVQRSSQRMLETVFTDVDTYVRFLRVAHMLEGPGHLMVPGTLAKVALPRLRRGGIAS